MGIKTEFSPGDLEGFCDKLKERMADGVKAAQVTLTHLV